MQQSVYIIIKNLSFHRALMFISCCLHKTPECQFHKRYWMVPIHKQPKYVLICNFRKVCEAEYLIGRIYKHQPKIAMKCFWETLFEGEDIHYSIFLQDGEFLGRVSLQYGRCKYPEIAINCNIIFLCNFSDLQR